VTNDGFELAFGVNYLSHYLLTRLLGNSNRIVNVSSEAHRPVSDLAPELGLGRTRSLFGWREYQFSKATQIAFTCSLAARGRNAYAAHPGVIATDLWRQMPNPFRYLLTRRMKAPAAGAIPLLRAATDQSLVPGDYVTPRGKVAPSPLATDVAAGERLWEQSEMWVRAYLS
jgi:NAD(P)-dependent dehydrogenase (short-subunit alcohol dehydrogenase family)